MHFNTGDEQSSTEMRKFMTKFRTLAHAGATVLLLHHTGKAKPPNNIAAQATFLPPWTWPTNWKASHGTAVYTG